MNDFKETYSQQFDLPSQLQAADDELLGTSNNEDAVHISGQQIRSIVDKRRGERKQFAILSATGLLLVCGLGALYLNQPAKSPAIKTGVNARPQEVSLTWFHELQSLREEQKIELEREQELETLQKQVDGLRKRLEASKQARQKSELDLLHTSMQLAERGDQQAIEDVVQAAPDSLAAIYLDPR
ncbi:MAG: hypothetical protein AAF483_08510 [Planctomycetota bacterium]